MYRNSFQRGMLTVFFSVGSKPLGIWDVHIKDGYVTRFLDQDIKSMVLEIGGTNVSTTYITCPKDNKILGITMPFLVMIVKNMKKYFSFEVTILDETGTRRRFRVSNFQSSTQILPLCTVMPIGLSDGWNQIQFNLAEFTRRAYKKQFVEVQKLKVNANIRLRRIYFTERLLPEDKLPAEYKLFFPLSSQAAKNKKAIQATALDKENIQPTTSQKLLEQAIQPDETSHMKSSKTSIRSLKKQPSKVSKKESKTEVETEKLQIEGDKFPADETEVQEKVEEPVTETDAAEETLAAETEAAAAETEAAAAETEAATAETEAVAAEIAPTETDAAEIAQKESENAQTVTAESGATEEPAP